MKLSCLFGSHDWDGCVCRRCGRKRDKFHDWDNCLCLRCGKKKCESDTSHQWEFTGKEEKYCSTKCSRGGGQHLDPCYGVDCRFCDIDGYENVYVCKHCGMEKREQV